MCAAFLASTREIADLNQYWYSESTIAALVSASTELAARAASARGEPEAAGRIAFLSTPSLYFALPASARSGAGRHAVLDIDTQWAADAGFARFDFRAGADALPAPLRGAFDVCVIDPPFITEEVWRAYADAARALLRADGGALVLTTVAENADLLRTLFGARRTAFQPSIPNLVYQYDSFCACDGALPTALAKPNPEIPA